MLKKGSSAPKKSNLSDLLLDAVINICILARDEMIPQVTQFLKIINANFFCFKGLFLINKIINCAEHCVSQGSLLLLHGTFNAMDK